MRRLKSFAVNSMTINKTSRGFALLTLVSLVFITTSYARANTLERSITAPNVDVSVGIGEGTLELFGYGPPLSKVILEGRGMYAATSSDKNGYFYFSKARIHIGSQEVCVTALSGIGASTHPVCIGIPNKKYVRIGPVILPPIVNMNKLKYNVRDFTVVRGSTVPQSTVKVKLFSTDSLDNSSSGLPLPEISAQSDTNGNFTINLPSDSDQRFRFYAQTTHNNAESGKSTTLTIDILAPWMSILVIIKNLLSQFVYLLPVAVILLESAFLIWFFFVRKKRKNELMIVEDHALMKEKHELAIQNTPSDAR
ncbi:MAG: hypothetical protein UZ22_OP11002001155 [Microgenomates bacterium OLB23]|nr:MAG: hypothetical protein UZ22_OP11002001155 [Microgenomates bacterium OLB23]